MPLREPLALPGQRIGLLGGSFDPPHPGHLHISRSALRSFGLDRVWWLVSPRNPLKPRGPAALEARLSACRALIGRHPRIEATGIEARLGSRYTADTLPRLSLRFPGVRFVWLMGADNLVGFHRWQRWEAILLNYPVGVLARPGEQLRAGLSPAARRFARWRLPVAAARALAHGPAPRWVLLTGPMSPVSSTALRAGGEWPGSGAPESDLPQLVSRRPV